MIPPIIDAARLHKLVSIPDAVRALAGLFAGRGHPPLTGPAPQARRATSSSWPPPGRPPRASRCSASRPAIRKRASP
jgi:hypothetical protein